MKYEYVVSGPSHSLTARAPSLINPNKDVFLGYLKTFKSELLKLGEYDFSILYNGYNEYDLGVFLHSIFGECAKFYSDSGGLQMITLGHSITEELKHKVYLNQAKCGDYAMSFDEIPVKLLAEKSSRSGMSSRVVDTENFDNYAIESAKNLKAQIKTFKECNTKSRPFMIIQGYSLESYQHWADTLLGHLDQSDIDYIGGVACGAAALGQGQLEDFKRAYICANIVLPEHIKNHIHLLGVGSISRLIPYAILHSNGTLNTKRLSFDSSTHSSALSMANFQLGSKLVSYINNPAGKELIVDILEDFYSKFGVSFERQYTHDCYFLQTSKLVAKYGEDIRLQFQHHKILNMFCNVYNFMVELDKLDRHPEKYIIENFPSIANQFMTFGDVVDDKSLSRWLSYNKSSIATSPVRIQSSTLGDFFV